MAPIKRAKTWSDADSTAKELHLEGEPELNLHEQEERIEKDSRSLKEEVRELKEHRVVRVAIYAMFIHDLTNKLLSLGCFQEAVLPWAKILVSNRRCRYARIVNCVLMLNSYIFLQLGY